MITSRDDYATVTWGANLRIDGGIMPARDMAGDGSWSDLRGEDVAYAWEYLGRYANANGVGVISPSYMDASIRASKWTRATASIRAQAPLMLQPDGQALAYKSQSTPWETYHTLFDIYGDGIRLDQQSLISSSSDFVSGGPLRADPIRRVYHDLDLFRRGAAANTSDHSRIGNTYVVSSKSGNVSVYGAQGETLVHCSAVNDKEGFIEEYGHARTRASGEIVINPLDYRGWNLMDELDIVVECRHYTDTYDRANYRHTYSTIYEQIVVPGVRVSRYNGYAVVVSLDTLSSRVESLHSWPTETSLPARTSRTVINSINNIRCVVRDTRVDFHDIGWSYST